MKYLIFFLLSLQVSLVSAQEEEIWYVWIDTEITQNNKKVRIVSDEPIRITCCVKSPKYRRFQKKTAKWIKKNYDESFNLETPLRNIEDKSFAETVIKDAVESAEQNDLLKIINYSASCK